MSKLLTMIIPVYNTEKYLERCISSCISEEVQIIAIDDGSTDNSLETLKRLKATYQDIEILNGNHQGAVHARRMGLAKVNTKYLLIKKSSATFYNNPNIISEMCLCRENF